MRELEFLPSWYNRLQGRRRTVYLQTWMTLVVAGALGSWIYLADRNERTSSDSLQSIQAQLVQADSQLDQMQRLEALRRQMKSKAEVLNNLGSHVDAARLIAKISEVMPPEIALMTLQFELEEAPVQLTGAARAALKDPTKLPVDRRLRVRLVGVAPTDVELATFLTDLNKVRFFEHVAPTYAKDHPEEGRLLREFELLFWINLNLPAEPEI